jgi:hypothetical protein
VDDRKPPIATCGNNVYVVWSTNKSGDSGVMFKAGDDELRRLDLKSIEVIPGISGQITRK